jgi:DNA-binding NarL/FixJ family response regulator
MKRPTRSIRLVLADDHPLVRAGIRAELENLPSIEVVGEANDGREALEMAAALSPDVVFIDISMPGLNGLETVERMIKEFPDVRVIILSMHENEEYVWRALKAGASGYLLKRSATTELGAALRRVAQGEIYLCKAVTTKLLRKFPRQNLANLKNPVEKLTLRQREILQLIAEGQNTKEIANLLKLSAKTVEYHRMQLMDRLNIHNIPGLVRFALRVGLIPLEG